MEYPKLVRQPLTAVIADFRFSPILQIQDKVPQIQERLRAAYPGFFTRLSAQPSIRLGTPQQMPMAATPVAWFFVTASRRQSIFLEPNRVIVLTADYDRFPNFQASCRYALETINEVVGLGILERVGLRYNNAIDPALGLTLADYLIPQLLPATDLLEGDTAIFHQYATAIKTQQGTLQVRALIGRTGLPMMPDMLTIFPAPVHAALSTDHDTAVLDFDHFREDQGAQFSVDTAIDHLETLHERARKAFWSVTTKQAKEVYWK